MTNIWWIIRREVGYYLRSPIGYIIIFAVLVFDGLLYNAFAVGSGALKSSQVLENFFLYSSGVTMTASVFIGMRLIAEERQAGTLVLLATSPVREWQLVLGKYLSAMVFLTVMTASTIYMPILVMINGKVSLAHILAGYLGVLLIGAASIALVMLCSALAPNQLVAAVLGGGAVLIFLLMWLLSKIASPPVEDLLAYLSLHDKHFRPFMRGVISIQDVVFYVSLSYVALLMTTRVLESRRWR
jgi:ABC-2 type transport system permease protein